MKLTFTLYKAFLRLIGFWPKGYEDLMLDLETLGTGPRATIWAIGIIPFNPYGVADESFYVLVNPLSAEKYGVTDHDTVTWWNDQNPQARAELDRAYKDGLPLAYALALAENFIQKFPEANIWGNGVRFDNVILANAFTAVQREIPWGFRQDRCFRTIRALWGNDDNRPRNENPLKHHALEDARYQAEWLRRILW